MYPPEQAFQRNVQNNEVIMDHKAINDVRRKINEVMKRDEGKVVVGWRPEFAEKRQEGEVWEGLDGRMWTMKNGIKQTVTKLDDAKTPWWCPQCAKALAHRIDDKFWRIRGKCMDCVIKEEMEIRKQGPEAWQAYEKKVMWHNYVAALKDKIAEYQDYHDTVSAPEFIDADGHTILNIEKWDVNLDKIKADIRADIEQLQIKLDEMLAEGEPV
jgi:hypothetical protein